MSDDRRYIPKGTKPRVCKECRTVVYHVYAYAPKSERQELIVLDCTGPETANPKMRCGGAGRPHVCKKAVA